MSEGKRPDLKAFASISSGTVPMHIAQEIARYALALEGGLVKVTEALLKEREPLYADRKKYGGVGYDPVDSIIFEAEKLIAQIPAPQKESR